MPQARFCDAVVKDGILQVCINRPEKRNALSQTVLGELCEIFAAHAADPSLIAATLTGAGDRCFAAGGDLKEMESVRSVEATNKMALDSMAALDAVRFFPAPVIALLNGDAIGGGAELAAACDLRISAVHSRIAFVQANMGISPGWGGGADLVRIVGGSRALRLLVRAEFLDAPTAQSLGLVDAIAPDNVPFAEFVKAFMQPVCLRKPQVMRAIKDLTIAARRTPEWAALRELELNNLRATWLHDDHWAASAQALTRISGQSNHRPE